MPEALIGWIYYPESQCLFACRRVQLWVHAVNILVEFVVCRRKAINVALVNCSKYDFNLVILLKMTKLKMSLTVLKVIL